MSETKIPSARLDTTEFTFTELAVNSGTAALPSYSFTTDQDTGMYRPNVDSIGFSTGGTLAMVLGSSQRAEFVDGTAALPAISFLSDINTGIWRSSADTMNFATGGTNRWQIDSGGSLVSANSGASRLMLGDGSAATPSLTFGNDPDTGIYRSGSGEISYVANGSIVFRTEPGLVRSVVNFIPDATNTLTLGTATNAWARSLLSAGSVSSPAYTFASDQDTGLFIGGANFLSVTAGGVEVASFAGTTAGSAFLPGVNDTYALGSAALGWTKLYMMDGTAALPAVTWRNDTDTGMYRIGANQLGLSAGGTGVLYVSATQLSTMNSIPLRMPDGSAATPIYSFDNDPDTGIYRSGTNSMVVTLGGTSQWDFNANGTIRGQSSTTNLLQPGFGSAATPGHSFTGDEDTGMYRSASDILKFSAGGNEIFQISTGTIEVRNTAQFQVAAGTALLPGIAFNSENATGMYRPASNTLGFSVAGLGEMVRITSSGNLLHGTTSPTGYFTSRKDQDARTRIAFLNDSSGTNASSDIYLAVGSGTSQDPRITFAIGGPTREWVIGCDNSDSDVFKFSVGTSGVELSGAGQFCVTPNATPQQINPDGTSALPYYSFYNDQDTGMYRSGADALDWSVGGAQRLALRTGQLSPGATDGTMNLGSGSARWNTVFATNSTINTSHSSTKSNIVEIDPSSVEIPQGVFFDRGGRRYVGYLNDTLPVEARPTENGKVLDTMNYENAVIGVLCAHVRKLEADNAEMKSLIQELKNKVEA